MSRQTSLVKVVVGILQQGHYFLVAERPAGKPYSGYWEFPGGKIEPQETPVQALQRELKEELNIIVTKAHAWQTHQHSYPDKSVELHLWCIQSFQGMPEPIEQQTLRWVRLHELSSLRILEGNLPLLSALNELIV